MEICLQLTELVKLLKDEEAQAKRQGYNTVTLTQQELMRITKTLALASKKIAHTSSEVV